MAVVALLQRGVPLGTAGTAKLPTAPGPSDTALLADGVRRVTLWKLPKNPLWKRQQDPALRRPEQLRADLGLISQRRLNLLLVTPALASWIYRGIMELVMTLDYGRGV